MKNIPTNLSNWKSKVDKFDVDELVPVPVDLTKLRDVVKKDIVNPNLGVGVGVAAFSNILLETSVPNLVSITYPSLQILGKTQTGVFLISRFLVNPL